MLSQAVPTERAMALFNPGPRAAPAQNKTPTKHYQQNQCQYEINFPEGPMGLELEPVITSSERTIGCRVKDFYFGLEYDGLDRQYLQEHVAIGDIIIKVNDTAVVSLPFSKILDILRSLTGSSRVVVFKNITAACKPLPSHLHPCIPASLHPCTLPHTHLMHILLSFHICRGIFVEQHAQKRPRRQPHTQGLRARHQQRCAPHPAKDSRDGSVIFRRCGECFSECAAKAGPTDAGAG
jgi:hypothetical protein